MPEEKDRTVYREAGFATARIFLGIEFEVVSIYRDGRSEDQRKDYHGPARDWRVKRSGVDVDAFEKLDNELIACFAGACAEDMHTGAYGPARVPDDDPEALALIGRVFKPGNPLARMYMREAWIRTYRFLRSHWRIVDALAKALRESKQLTADEARAVANDALLDQWQVSKDAPPPAADEGRR